MTPWIVRSRRVRVAAAALGLGLGLVGATLWHATRRVGPPLGGAPPADDAVPTSVPIRGYALERVLAAVNKDPFHPQRHRPAVRFQMPADQATLAAQRADQQGPQSLRLLGTAVSAGGSGFAMCEWQGGARIVRVGEQVAGWTLVSVTPGAAEFATPSGHQVVRVPKAGT